MAGLPCEMISIADGCSVALLVDLELHLTGLDGRIHAARGRADDEDGQARAAGSPNWPIRRVSSSDAQSSGTPSSYRLRARSRRPTCMTAAGPKNDW